MKNSAYVSVQSTFSNKMKIKKQPCVLKKPMRRHSNLDRKMKIKKQTPSPTRLEKANSRTRKIRHKRIKPIGLISSLKLPIVYQVPCSLPRRNTERGNLQILTSRSKSKTATPRLGIGHGLIFSKTARPTPKSAAKKKISGSLGGHLKTHFVVR